MTFQVPDWEQPPELVVLVLWTQFVGGRVRRSGLWCRRATAVAQQPVVAAGAPAAYFAVWVDLEPVWAEKVEESGRVCRLLVEGAPRVQPEGPLWW